jgi:hypothetical protein
LTATDELSTEAARSGVSDADDVLYDLIGKGIVFASDMGRADFVMSGFGVFVKTC